MPAIGVTGANGFVGRELVRSFAARGHRVVAFLRSKHDLAPGIDHRSYDLDAGLSAAALADVDVLIHAAFIRSSTAAPNASERNVSGTRRLYEAALESETTFVFLSSISARPDARSAYGMHKYALETMLAGNDALIVRPGLVIGDGGLIRSLYTYLKRGIVPLIDRGAQVVPTIGTEDLVDAIATALRADLRGRHTVCSDETVRISTIVTSMAARFALRPTYVNVPWGIAFAVARLAERAGVTFPLTTENLLGMKLVETEPPSVALEEAGWRARRWAELLPDLTFADLKPSTVQT